MLSFDAALGLIASAVQALPAEMVALGAAHGRRLATPALAAIDSPRATVSTMDGYAVGSAGEATDWTVIGTAYPGEPFAGLVAAGQAVRIFTGAPLPSCTDRVVIQENVRRDGDQINLTADPGEMPWVRAKASDFAAGDALLPMGHRLDARALVALAGADLSTASVFRQPRVSIIATGNELVSPGEARHRAHAVPDSLSTGLAAFITDWGGLVTGASVLADEPQALADAARRAVAGSDVVVMTGGASLGERDYARTAWADLGIEMLFSKIAVKPGKPVWIGRVDGCWIVGLPGNPTSAMVTARLFLAPLLTLLGGGMIIDALAWRPARLAAPLGSTGDRETFIRAQKARDNAVAPLSNQDSGAQATLAYADCLIRMAAGESAKGAGAEVTIIDW